MPSSKYSRKFCGTIFLIILCITLLSGCASQRWSKPLSEDDSSDLALLLGDMQSTEKLCPNSFDADAKIFWKTPVANSAIVGYLQVLSPSHSKYVITNPLGMLTYAWASDGKTFQILDTIEHRYIRGNVRSLMIRQQLPLVFAEESWFLYLTGRLPIHPLTIQKSNYDESDQTVWVLSTQSNQNGVKRWLHIDPAKRLLLGFLFLDEEGKTVAEISYEETEANLDICLPKKHIQISNLPWGAEVHIEMENINTSIELQASDFNLPVPTDYYKQFLP